MKKLLLAAVIGLLASPAAAGTIQITVTGGGGLSYTVTNAVPDASISALIAFSRATYGQVEQTPASGDTPAVMRDMTQREAIEAWWRGILRGTANNLRNAAQEAAARTAKDAITAVPFGE